MVKNDADSSFDEDMLDSASFDNPAGRRRVVTQSQVVVKTLILAPNCQLSDEALMQENETIANPTNKKLKAELTPKKETFFADNDIILDETDFFRAPPLFGKVPLPIKEDDVSPD